MSLDVLAIAAHPDDVEQTCGGTLIKMAEVGYRTGVLDLTAGDMGTRGCPAHSRRTASDKASAVRASFKSLLEEVWKSDASRTGFVLVNAAHVASKAGGPCEYVPFVAQ
jgi:hypothetical protein